MNTKDNDINIVTGSRAQSIEHAHIKRKESSPLNTEGASPHFEIEEERWPEFRKSVKERFPDVSDSDLPYKRHISDDYFGRIEKKYGHSRQSLSEVASAFHTWRAPS